MRHLYFIFFFLFFISCKQNYASLSKITAKRIDIDSTIKADVEIKNSIAPFKENLEKDMKKELTYAPIDLVKSDGNRQSSLGNLLADLCYEMANPIFNTKTQQNIDFVLFNSGGLRAPISKGKVTTENAFMLMPFENELVVTQLSGDKVADLFQFFIKSKSAHPLSKEVALIIDGDESSISIHGKPFQKNKSYWVLTSDYLQNGGDNMHFFAAPEKLVVLDYKVRDAIIDYFKKIDTIKTTLDQRVIVK